VKTKAGATAGVEEPWEDVKRGLATAMEQMNKAFAKAGEEMRKAFEEARKEFRWESTSKGRIVCAHCGASNPSEAKFCSKCGKSIS